MVIAGAEDNGFLKRIAVTGDQQPVEEVIAHGADAVGHNQLLLEGRALRHHGNLVLGDPPACESISQFLALHKRRGKAAKAEARRKRREILEFLRKNAWRCQDSAQKCARAVAKAITRLLRHLASGVDAEGKKHQVLQDFAWHLREHLLMPSGRDLGYGGARRALASGGFFTYEPPPGVVWRRD